MLKAFTIVWFLAVFKYHRRSTNRTLLEPRLPCYITEVANVIERESRCVHDSKSILVLKGMTYGPDPHPLEVQNKPCQRGYHVHWACPHSMFCERERERESEALRFTPGNADGKHDLDT